MTEISIRCPINGCGHRIRVTCREDDQVVFCPRCLQPFNFSNTATFKCSNGACQYEVHLAVNQGIGGWTCRDCGHTAWFDPGNPTLSPGVAFYEPKHDRILECRLGQVENHEDEPRLAKGLFKRRNAQDKTTYVRLVHQDLGYPVRHTRFLHATCNFKYSPYDDHDVKLWGRLSGFIRTQILQEYVDVRGLKEIWFGDQAIMAELETFPSMAQLKKRFRFVT